MPEEAMTIVTMRVEDQAIPASGSQKGLVCNDCGEPVWIHHTSLSRMEDAGSYLICCNRCVGEKLLREEDLQLAAADPELDEIFREHPELKEDFIGFMIAQSLKDSGGS